MIWNYLLITIRTFLKFRQYSIINISGLALGMAVSIYMLYFVQQELSYDTTYPNHARIYRLASQEWAKSSPPCADAVINSIPQVESIGRFARSMTGGFIEMDERDVPVSCLADLIITGDNTTNQTRFSLGDLGPQASFSYNLSYIMPQGSSSVNFSYSCAPS